MPANQRCKPIIWTISGADCSGGAGIAADIKTAHALGVEICHLITANTVQNSKTLLAVNPISTLILSQQANALIEDKPPSVIKIGLLANQEQVQWLIHLLQKLKEQQPKLIVVFDPVGQASVGGKFSSLTLADLRPLLKWVDIVTPNLPEAIQLSSPRNIDNLIVSNWEHANSLSTNRSDSNYRQSTEEMAKTILGYGVRSVIIKGGHHNSDIENNADGKVDHHGKKSTVTDYCLHTLNSAEQTAYQLTSERIATSYSHGGGCSFATSLSAYLADGYLLRDAFTLSKAFMQQGLVFNQGKFDYYGAFEQPALANIDSNVCFPTVSDKTNAHFDNLPAFKPLGISRNNKQELGLYPVVDSIEWLEQLLPLNLNIIQLRLKNIENSKTLSQLIEKAVTLCKNSSTRLFINDYWQLAIEHGAYGVHIGQEDLLAADLAAINKAGLRLGISTHGCYEFLLAQQLKPSYLAIGAIFPTQTKDMTGQIQGVENLSQILKLSSDIPVVAIGGINQQRAKEVWQTGVDSIAVVTAITKAENPIQAVQDFQQLLNESKL